MDYSMAVRKSIIHPRNLWVPGSILTEGQPAKLPSFGGYSLETLPYLTYSMAGKDQQQTNQPNDLAGS